MNLYEDKIFKTEIGLAVKELRKAVNRVPGMKVTCISDGFGIIATTTTYVWFKFKDQRWLKVISRCFDNRYGGMRGFRSVLSNSDTGDFYGLTIEGPKSKFLANEILRTAMLIDYWRMRVEFNAKYINSGSTGFGVPLDEAINPKDPLMLKQYDEMEKHWADLVTIEHNGSLEVL